MEETEILGEEENFFFTNTIISILREVRENISLSTRYCFSEKENSENNNKRTQILKYYSKMENSVEELEGKSEEISRK